MKKCLTLFMAVTMAVVLTGCGTLFKSERIGKRSSDRIDPAIMILDCCGLLFGIIPGVVALVLDFNNKTIYFSNSEVSMGDISTEDMIALQVESMDQAAIEEAVSAYLGRAVTLNELNLTAMN